MSERESTATSPDATHDPTAEARIAEARELRPQARRGGLCFYAYLPPDLADWLLDQIEHGVFSNPSEAVIVTLGERRGHESQADLLEAARHGLAAFLQRIVRATVDDPRPSRSTEATEMEPVGDEALEPAPAVWRKVL